MRTVSITSPSGVSSAFHKWIDSASVHRANGEAGDGAGAAHRVQAEPTHVAHYSWQRMAAVNSADYFCGPLQVNTGVGICQRLRGDSLQQNNHRMIISRVSTRTTKLTIADLRLTIEKAGAGSQLSSANSLMLLFPITQDHHGNVIMLWRVGGETEYFVSQA